MKRIAIFASGTGSNARRIMEHFQHSVAVQVSIVISNKPDAPVLDVAHDFGVDTIVIDREEFYQTESLLGILEQRQIDLLVLAGFLWLVPAYLIQAFSQRIVNIHPALLPQYGGKGMYGMRVHEAVKAGGEQETGISIHYVDECYDEGHVIFQSRCPVLPDDTPEAIAQRVLSLEHRHFPVVLEQILLGRPIIGAPKSD